MKKKILISDKVHPLLIDGLNKAEFNVDYFPKMPYKDVKSSVSDYNGIIINSKVICDQSFLDSVMHLDFIGRLGSGLDIIDLPYAKEKGIEIISSPEGNANAVAEHSMGMLLSLFCNIGKSHQDVLQFNWNREPNRGEEVKGKIVGIVGFGHTGPAFAEKLSRWHVEVLAHDKYRSGFDGLHGVHEVSLEEIKKKSDIISINLPLTAETRNMITVDFLSNCKKGVILLNTSRGAIVKSQDLLHCLQNGQVHGACLDVLENEKPKTWSKKEKEIYGGLLALDNVIITPHIAGWTHQSLQLIAEILLHKIVSFYKW